MTNDKPGTSASGRFARALVPILLLVVVGLSAAFWWWRVRQPDAQTVVASTLHSVRAQNRLTPFVARYVAVVTSTQSRFGLEAQKTLIMPGMVRYEVDFQKMGEQNLAWDAGTKTLTVTLPPLELAGPDIDMAAVREYGSGGLLMALTNAEAVIDTANRQAGQADLLKQARAPVVMQLAETAAINAVQSVFTMPLQALNIDAKVVVRVAPR